MNGMNLNPKHPPPPKKRWRCTYTVLVSMDFEMWQLHHFRVVVYHPSLGEQLLQSYGSLTLRLEYSEWNIPRFLLIGRIHLSKSFIFSIGHRTSSTQGTKRLLWQLKYQIKNPWIFPERLRLYFFFGFRNYPFTNPGNGSMFRVIHPTPYSALRKGRRILRDEKLANAARKNAEFVVLYHQSPIDNKWVQNTGDPVWKIMECNWWVLITTGWMLENIIPWRIHVWVM